MAAQLNGLDYAIIAIVGFGALYGLGRGALRMATSILSLALGLYAASTWYLRVGAYVEKLFKTSPTVSGAIGYALVFILVFVAIEFAGRRVIMLVNLVNLGCIDRLAGGVFGAVLGVVLAGLTIVAITAFSAPNPPMITNSQFAPTVLAYNEALLAYVPPEVKKEYETKREQVYRYWVDRKKAPAHSPPANE
jgi:membrane protein required for colicin V production